MRAAGWEPRRRGRRCASAPARQAGGPSRPASLAQGEPRQPDRGQGACPAARDERPTSLNRRPSGRRRERDRCRRARAGLPPPAAAEGHRSHTRGRRQCARGAMRLWRAGTHRAGRPRQSRPAVPPRRTPRPGMSPPPRPGRAPHDAMSRGSAPRRAGEMRPQPRPRREPRPARPIARARWRALHPVRPLPRHGARPGDPGLEQRPSPRRELRAPGGDRPRTLRRTRPSGRGDDGSEPGSRSRAGLTSPRARPRPSRCRSVPRPRGPTQGHRLARRPPPASVFGCPAGADPGAAGSSPPLWRTPTECPAGRNRLRTRPVSNHSAARGARAGCPPPPEGSARGPFRRSDLGALRRGRSGHSPHREARESAPAGPRSRSCRRVHAGR